MTNLTPVSSNDSVVQLETSNFALGGPGAVMNLQAQALLNRQTFFQSSLADSADPTKGLGLLGWARAPFTTTVSSAHRMLDAQTVNLWEFTSFVTNFGLYATTPFLCDWAPALEAAFATGKRVYAPSVPVAFPYVILSKVNLANTVCNLVGDGDSSLFILDTVMDHMFERLDDGTPASKASVIFENFKIDCNRKADWGLWIESSLKGGIKNVTVDRFLVGGATLGTDSFSTNGYYENRVEALSLDAGVFFSSVVGTMASYGLYMALSATDNVLYNVVSKYTKETGIYINGASNKFYSPHAFGNNATDTGPKYCVIAANTCEVTCSHNDNPTIAGISIRASNVQVIGGTFQWAADNVPTLGGAVPIEIETGLNEVVILGGNPRNENVSNPTIRYLGTKPIRSTILGISPYQPATGEDAGHFVARQLGVQAMDGYRTQLNLEAPSANSAAMRYFRNGILRYEFGTTSTAEAGGNSGTDFSWTARKDDTSTVEFFKYFRQFNLTELRGQIKIGLTGENVGFYGTNPIAKPTVTGSRGGNAALSSLITALASQGLITDSTTA